MPTYDQDGNQTDMVEMRLTDGALVKRIEVRHAEVLLFGEDDEALIQVIRPTHPGAGLALSVADHVETL